MKVRYVGGPRDGLKALLKVEDSASEVDALPALILDSEPGGKHVFAYRLYPPEKGWWRYVFLKFCGELDTLEEIAKQEL